LTSFSDHDFQISAKVSSLSNGGEITTRSRELARHFDTHGTPVMIGGGVKAFTILGVAVHPFDDDQSQFLILDPHYPGSDPDNEVEISDKIVQKGWVAWKTADMFSKSTFYNLCLPQRRKSTV
jgi:hypothetical protein